MNLKALAENIILRNRRCNSSADSATHPDIHSATSVATNTASVIKPQWISPDEREVVAWLDRIGETDPVVFQETLDKCRASADSIAFFLDLARNIRGMVN